MFALVSQKGRQVEPMILLQQHHLAQHLKIDFDHYFHRAVLIYWTNKISSLILPERGMGSITRAISNVMESRNASTNTVHVVLLASLI